jgi:lipopolysaccharide biosynthesis protein
MTLVGPAADTLPVNPRTPKRVIFYLFFDADGVVDDYVLYKLRALRPFAEHIFVVSNSELTVEGRARLESVSDTVWARENVGFDVWAYREAMQAFGSARLAEYDELILMNYTFFGPVYPFGETFDRMDVLDVDFWGLTEHKEIDPNPLTEGVGTLHQHLQSHWIAVRKSMFQSIEFEHYWATMPMIKSYTDSILQHETRFTQYFREKGFRSVCAFPADAYPADHPIFDNVQLMLEDRCPIVKRRLFFHEPAYLDRNAIIGRRVMSKLATTDYPLDLIWRNVVRSAEPRTLYTNLAMLSVLPDGPGGEPRATTPRVCVIAHIYYEDMAEEIAGRLKVIPTPFDVVITTDTASKRDRITKVMDDFGFGSVEVRVLESNRGRETSAFLVGCRDILLSDRYDLICKIHSKKSAQDSYNNATLFKDHLLDNLLSSPGYVAHLLDLFADPGLGMVFPPVINIGYPTLGHSGFTNRDAAEELAEELGIRTQFDRSTPVAPYGGMFWCRPEAIRAIAARAWDWTDFPDESGWTDGGLAHVIERLYVYAAMNARFHVRSVLNTDWAEINYTMLEYKLQRLASLLPAYHEDQYATLEVMQSASVLHALKYAVRTSFPWLGNLLRPGYKLARGAYRMTRSRRDQD